MASFKMVWTPGEHIVKFLNIYRNFEALWDTCNENYEKNASNNINKVMQEFTAGGLHSDNKFKT